MQCERVYQRDPNLELILVDLTVVTECTSVVLLVTSSTLIQKHMWKFTRAAT